MRTIWKVAAVVAAMGAAAIWPAKAQPYGYRYYGNDTASGYPAAPYGYDGDDGYTDDGGYYQGAYDDDGYGAGYYDAPYDSAYDDAYAGDGYYGADAYGYCDTYGCPDAYWDLPIYYGPVFYNDAWFNGPLYYRDWGGRRQYWIHGGWRYDAWRGERPSRYRAGRYGPALGLSWYRSNHVYRQGWRGGAHVRNGSRGYQAYRAPMRDAPNRFSTRGANRFQGRDRQWDANSYRAARRDSGFSSGARPSSFSGAQTQGANRFGGADRSGRYGGSRGGAGFGGGHAGGGHFDGGHSGGGHSGGGGRHR